MYNPSIDDLVKKVGNRYSLIVAVSKRARALIEDDAPLIETELKKPVSIAVRELSDDKFMVVQDV